MILKCSNWKRYKGIKKPRCSGGSGCKFCWTIFIESSSHGG